MSHPEQQQHKVVQYLNEAHGSEQALARVLQSQIAMTPRGSYRSGLEAHLDETRGHADRVERRVAELGEGSNRLTAVVGAAGSVVGQALAFSKTPWDLLRGSGGEEKVLKNAKDACAAEALEIATYTAIECLAGNAGDEQTAELAASILADEERMLARVMREIPKLTDAVVGAEIDGKPSYDLTATGAADAVREAGEATKDAARKTTAVTIDAARKTTAVTKDAARKTTAVTKDAVREAGEATKDAARNATEATKRTARQARKLPGVAQAEGQAKGAAASEADLAIARYDTLTADEITSRLTGLSQVELAKVDSYERRNQDRTTILRRIGSLRADEPWAGYDELTAAEVQAVLSEGDDERAKQAHAYERTHKNRAGVLKAAEREHSTSA